MTQSEYIEAAFQAYYPTSVITVDDETDDETIHVHVVTPTDIPDHFVQISWVFTAGSDDDRYIFTRDNVPDDHGVITVPLMPEVA